MSAGDTILICPYNKAHSIISSRMQFHLAKCRMQYPNVEKTICPYNSTHVINKIELEIHKQICDDRIVMDLFYYKMGNSSAPRVEITRSEPVIITGECWDDNALPVSVLETVQEASKNKPTLSTLIGAPKSERKAFRNQERLRIRRVLDSTCIIDTPPSSTGDDSIENINTEAKNGLKNGSIHEENCVSDINTNKGPPSNQAFDENKKLSFPLPGERQNLLSSMRKSSKDVSQKNYASVVNKVKEESCKISTCWGAMRPAPNSNLSNSEFPGLPVAGRGRGLLRKK